MRPALLHSHGLRNASTLMLLLGMWNGGEMLVLSGYLQQILHMSPLDAGLSIAPQGMVGLATGLLGARLTRHLGIQRVLVVTGTAATAGFAALTQLPMAGGSHLPLAAVMLVGFGTAGMAFGSMVTASAGIADHDQGLVGGVINTSRQLGAATGAALLPAVADAADRTRHTWARCHLPHVTCRRRRFRVPACSPESPQRDLAMPSYSRVLPSGGTDVSEIAYEVDAPWMFGRWRAS